MSFKPVQAIDILREAESIDEALSSYEGRSPSPRIVAIEDFATDVLQSQESLVVDDVAKLLQLEKKIGNVNREKADKICDLCLKLLLQEQKRVVSGPTMSKIEVLLARFPTYEEKVRIVTSVACLEPEDREVAIELLIEASNGEERVDNPFIAIFAGQGGEDRRQRALSYLDNELSSTNLGRRDAVAELIVLRHEVLFPDDNHPLYQKAKRIFIAPLFQKGGDFDKTNPEKINKICNLYIKLLLREQKREVEGPLIAKVELLLERVKGSDEKVQIVTLLACLRPEDRADAIERFVEALNGKQAFAQPYVVFFAGRDGEDRKRRALSYMAEELSSTNAARRAAIAELILLRHEGLIPNKNHPLYRKAKGVFVTPDTLRYLAKECEAELNAEELPVKLTKDSLQELIRNYEQALGGKEDRAFQVIKYLLSSPIIDHYMSQVDAKNPAPDAKVLFEILQFILSLPDRGTPGQKLSRQNELFMKFMKLYTDGRRENDMTRVQQTLAQYVGYARRNSWEYIEFNRIKKSLDEGPIYVWMNQIGKENPSEGAKQFFQIVSYVLNQSDGIAPGENLSPQAKAFIKYIGLAIASEQIRGGKRAGISSVYNQLPPDARYFVPPKPAGF